MIKLLFLDLRHFEHVHGFQRLLSTLTDHGTVFTAGGGWEQQTLGLYGTVLRREDGLFQMWYTGGRWGRSGKRRLGFATSNDGVNWERPSLDVATVDSRASNIVFDTSHVGCAVMLDAAEPRRAWRYKMVMAHEPHERIALYRSGDGIHWLPGAENPVIGTHPDGPMSFRRDRDGRYVLYHRPRWGDRRVARTESWDLREFTAPRVVLEPGPCDGANVQFYGMGAMQYGAYEIGTLWIYRTDPADLIWTKRFGVLDCELAHGRGGYAWHRTAPGRSWLPRPSDPAAFGHGQYHFSSSPVLLPEEIRFYYAGSICRHGEDNLPRETPGWGIGYASRRPDRFVGATCRSGELLTRPFWTDTPGLFVNAAVAQAGWLRAEVTDVAGNVIEPFSLDRSEAVTGDHWYQPLRWREADVQQLVRREIRIRIRAEGTTLFAVGAGSPSEAARYWQFELPYHLPMDLQEAGR